MPESPGATDPLRVLIVGAGKMGRLHARALATIAGVEIVAIASRGGESAARLAAELGVRRAGSDWQALADETRPDACVVAVSHAWNEPATAEAIERGLHVLAEKPVAFTSAGVRVLAARARQQGVLVMAAMNRRYFPSVAAAVELVRYHGRVLGVTVFAPDPVQPFRAQGRHAAFVYDHWIVGNTLHAIDLLRLAGGDVVRVTGDALDDPETGEVSIVATLRFAGEALGTLVLHAPSGGAWELRIHGPDVEAILNPLEVGQVRVGRGPTRPLPTATDPPPLRMRAGIRPQALAFVEAVRELRTLPWPASDLEDHARSVVLAEELAGIGQLAQAHAPPPATRRSGGSR